MKISQVQRLRMAPVLLCLCCVTTAVQAHQDGPDDTMSGMIDVSGSMLATPCSLATESVEQTVDMGKVPTWQLDRYGALSEPVTFHMYLQGCEYGKGFVRNVLEGNNGLRVPNQPVVAVTLRTVSDSSDPRLIAVEGEARGVALRIQDASQRILRPGVKGTFIPLEPGDNELVMTAQLSRTAQPLVPGDFMATVNFALEYE
jgi:type 1 fimbria pilin